MEKVHGTRKEYKLVEQDNYLLAEGLHELIISEEMWQATQVKLLAFFNSNLHKIRVCGSDVLLHKQANHSF